MKGLGRHLVPRLAGAAGKFLSTDYAAGHVLLAFVELGLDGWREEAGGTFGNFEPIVVAVGAWEGDEEVAVLLGVSAVSLLSSGRSLVFSRG